MPNRVTTTVHCSHCGLYLDMKEYLDHRIANCTKHGKRKAQPQDSLGRFIAVVKAKVNEVSETGISVEGQVMDTS